MLEKEFETDVEEVFHSDTVNKAKRLLKSRSGLTMVGMVSFIESATPLPILTDPFLIAAILVNRTRVGMLVLMTTATSTAGGVFAYLTGLLFIDILLKWMSPDIVEQFQSLMTSNQSSTLVLTLIGAITPVPYTLSCWAVGVLKGNLGLFIIASFIGRGIRYLVVGYSAYYFGPLAISYAKKYISKVSIFVFILVALFFWYKM